MKRVLTILCAVTVTATVAFTDMAVGANYPLELINIKPVGVDGMSANNRIFRAYPGIEYNIRAAVIGGAYPYTHTLSNAPSGMTINSRTGEISWPNPPTGITATPTITVTDMEGTRVSASWTITVTPTGFRFLDAVNGRSVAQGGTGTRENPWRSIRDMYEGSDYASKRARSYANEFLYFLNGLYYLDAYIENTDVDPPGRMPVPGGIKPVVWMAYPGHAPVISYAQGTSPGAHIMFYGSANDVYVDGFAVDGTAPVSFHHFMTDSIGNYQTFRRNTMGVLRSAVRSHNQSCFMTASGKDGSYGSYLVVQDNICHDVNKGAGFKIYATYKMLIEDNELYDVRDAAGHFDIEGIALKYGVDRGTVRHNVIHDIAYKGIGGNMHSRRNLTRDIEILFNRVYNASGNAIEINQDGNAGRIDIYRNTFVGRVQVRNADSSDGPFNVYNNVIINNDSGNHLYYSSVTDTSRIVTTNNLVGTPLQNIVDQNLNLTSALSSYVGTRGYQLENGDDSPPAPPVNLQVQF